MSLGKFAQFRPFVKFVDGFLGEIKAATDVHGFEPAFFPPAPDGAGSNAHLLAPGIQADDCSELLLCFHSAIVSHSFERNETRSEFKR
jgi:hypothetical protein